MYYTDGIFEILTQMASESVLLKLEESTHSWRILWYYCEHAIPLFTPLQFLHGILSRWLISMMLMRCVGVLYGHWEGLTPALTRGPISLDRTVSDSLASLPRQRGSAFVFIKGHMSAYICGEVSWHDGLQRTPADGVCEQKGCACVTTNELRTPELTRSLISRARSWNLSGERVMWGWAVRARVDMRN